jgi:PAS domain S-box-containing protein
MSSALPSDSAPSVHPEGFFDFLLEKTPDQVYFKDRHGRFLRASRAVAEMLGVASAEALIGKTDFDLWSAETARETAADEQRIMNTREPLVGKIERLVHLDGRISWDYTTRLPLLDSRGEVIGPRTSIDPGRRASCHNQPAAQPDRALVEREMPTRREALQTRRRIWRGEFPPVQANSRVRYGRG